MEISSLVLVLSLSFIMNILTKFGSLFELKKWSMFRSSHLILSKIDFLQFSNVPLIVRYFFEQI